jgi:hypothetical protein
MGYRTYLAVVNKEKAAAYRNHTPDMYLDKDGYLPDDDDGESTAFYQFVSERFDRKDEFCVSGLDIPDNSGEPFFVNQETQAIFEHYNPRVVGKEECLLAIELMRQFVLNYYKNAMDAGPDHWQAVVHDKIQTWEAPYKITPYNLNIKSKDIVGAMITEYEIFDMVRMYKSIDWEHDMVIFYGW